MATEFQHISGVAVKVLARIAARKAVKAEIRASGNRPAQVPAGEMLDLTKAYLANHPELYEQAMAQAWALAAKDHQGWLNSVLTRASQASPICRHIR